MNISKKFLIITFILSIVSISTTLLLWINIQSNRVYSVGMAVEFNDHAAAAWISYDKGWFKNVGINLTTFESYATGLALAAAIARGDIQVAWLCVGPAILAYSRGINLKLVAMTHEYGYAIVANKSNIRSIYDLEDKKVGAVREGSMADLLLNKVIEKYSLKNVTILRMKPMDQINALIEHQVDAIAVPEHYVAIARSLGYDILIKSQDIWPNMPGSALFVKQELIENNREAVKKLVELTVFATNWLKTHKNESIQIMATVLQTTEGIISDSMSRLNYKNEINVTAIQEVINYMARLGYIKKFNASKIIDYSFLKNLQEKQSSSEIELFHSNQLSLYACLQGTIDIEGAENEIKKYV
ncbi:MAG: ABC transporter substrate-binding protein [Candidatus Asgardarchaeia archaeon]